MICCTVVMCSVLEWKHSVEVISSGFWDDSAIWLGKYPKMYQAMCLLGSGLAQSNGQLHDVYILQSCVIGELAWCGLSWQLAITGHWELSIARLTSPLTAYRLSSLTVQQ